MIDTLDMFGFRNEKPDKTHGGCGNKTQGAAYECFFKGRCLLRGIEVYTSEADNHESDVVVGPSRHRVQVKGTSQDARDSGNFPFSAGRGCESKEAYSDVDFFAFYIERIDTFYILPSTHVNSVKFYINPSRGDYKECRENYEPLTK